MPPQKPAARTARPKPVIDPPSEIGGDYDRVEFAGLMQCCLRTIDSLYPDGPAKLATEGQTLQCKDVPDRATHRIIFQLGYWHLDRPEPSEEN